MVNKSLPIWQTIGIGIVAGIVITLVFLYYLLSPDEITHLLSWDELPFPTQFFVLVQLFLNELFGIIGALVGKFWKKTRLAIWIGAVVSPLVISVLFIMVAGSSCVGFC